MYMNNETKSPASESEERKIAPQTGELDAEKLDEVVGGVGGAGGAPAPHPVGPQGP